MIDLNLPQSLNSSGRLQKTLQTSIPMDGGYDLPVPTLMTAERKLPSTHSLSARHEQSPRNHNSAPALTRQSKLESTKLRSSVSLQRNTQLRRTLNGDQHQVKTSFEGLVCESGPLCPGTGCTSQISYLWNMTQLYTTFHAKYACWVLDNQNLLRHWHGIVTVLVHVEEWVINSRAWLQHGY